VLEVVVVRTRGIVPLVVGALLLAALTACGGDVGDATTDTTAGTSTTTIEATTTTAGGSTTTTAGGQALAERPPIDEEGPSGSGCTPGDADVLPDGWWYGRLVVPPGEGLDFDLACYYVGAAAEAIAAERGDEVSNDYYVVDDNPAVRPLTIASGATASCVQLETTLEMVDCTPPDVDGEWALWIRVVDGEVDRMVEQYAP
jgi:hypothetical protein